MLIKSLSIENTPFSSGLRQLHVRIVHQFLPVVPEPLPELSFQNRDIKRGTYLSSCVKSQMCRVSERGTPSRFPYRTFIAIYSLYYQEGFTIESDSCY